MDPDKPVLVPETVLRRLRQDDGMLKRRRKKPEIRKLKKKSKPFRALIRPEKLVKAFLSKENDQRRLYILKKKKEAKKKQLTQMRETTKKIHIQKDSVIDPYLVLVIRVRDDNGISDEVSTILRKLHLHSRFNAVFMEYNTKNKELLEKIRPFVVYGKPSLAHVKELLQKRACVRIKNAQGHIEQKHLSTNLLVEEALGKFDILCVDDLVDQLLNLGNHLSEVLNLFVPFNLSSFESEFARSILKRKQWKKGGLYPPKDFAYFLKAML